jgi:hypothetical protein
MKTGLKNRVYQYKGPAMENTANTAEAPTPPATPDIGKNLFWDDFRIGLKVLCGGIAVLLAGVILVREPQFLSVAIVVIGALVTLVGLKICASIPDETGKNPLALAAFLSAKLCALLAVIAFFMSSSMLALVAVVLGGIAYILFMVVFQAAAQYLRHPTVSAFSLWHLIAAGVISVLLIAVAATGLWATSPMLLLLLQVLTAAALIFFMVHALELSAAIQRVQQGQPLILIKEAKQVAAAEEETVEHEVLPQVHPEGAKVFSEDIVGKLHAQDNSAGKAIVLLMTGVFSVGVILYAIIAIWAS